MNQNLAGFANGLKEEISDLANKRLATTKDLILVFSICAFPIFVWSTFNMLHKVPAWLKQYDAWDMVGIIAYTQLFSLIETISVFLLLVTVGAVLPSRLLREKFASLGSIMVLLTSTLLILIHYNNRILLGSNLDRRLVFVVYMVTIGLLYLVSFTVFYVFIQRSKKAEESILSIANRIMFLSLIYIGLSLVSTVIVFIRNI